MVSPGNTFVVKAPPYHRWVVISAPDDDGDVLVVNLTTLKQGAEDQSCVLQPEDYPSYIKRPTVVRYNKAMQLPAERIEREADLIERTESIPPPALRKIQEAALKSPFLRERFKRIVRRELGTTLGDPEGAE